MPVEKINVGAGKKKSILWPGQITIENRAQIPITISGELAHAGLGRVQVATTTIPTFKQVVSGSGFIKQQ